MEITMNTKQTIILITVFLLTAAKIQAQHITKDETSISYDVHVMDYSDCSCENIPMQVTNSAFRINLAHDAGSAFQVNHSLSYKHHDKGFRGFFDLSDADEVVLHSDNYSYNLSTRFQMNDNWSLRGYFKPRLRSYLEENDKTFYADYEGGMMLEFSKNSKWIFGAGYAYSHTLSEGLIHPTVLLQYDNGQSFRASVYFPEHAEIWFTPGERFAVGLTAILEGDEFIGKKSVYGGVKTSVQYADFTVGPEAEFFITDFLTLSLRTAYTAGRHLVVESDNERERLHPSPTWTVSAGIKIRLP
jgi:hypothetical protein